MLVELFSQSGHQCLMFTDVDKAPGDVVQSNQFLILNGDAGALIDPGGNVAYNELYLEISRHFPPSRLAALLASHADPDIIASLDRWMTGTTASLYISALWQRFAPHFCKAGKTENRIVGIPDSGMRIGLGGSEIVALPAHFLHAEGNFQFYDPVSRILFSGDLGASFGTLPAGQSMVTSLADHIPRMQGFHERLMVSNKVLRLWVHMVRSLKIDMIVPQHGYPMHGAAVQEFLAWVQELRCGIDLLDQRSYVLP